MDRLIESHFFRLFFEKHSIACFDLRAILIILVIFFHHHLSYQTYFTIDTTIFSIDLVIIVSVCETKSTIMQISFALLNNESN